MKKLRLISRQANFDLKQTFNSADYVKGLVVFNVGGNNFKAVAEVVYMEQIVRIAMVGTHAEYDGWKLCDLSQSELSRRLGAPQSVISEFLAGKRGLSKTLVLKIAAHFKVSPELFLSAKNKL